MQTLLDEILEEAEISTASADFPDPNECWRGGSTGRPDWSTILLKVEAALIVPERCADPARIKVTLRDVRQGGATAWAEVIRFGVSDGTTSGALDRPTRVSETDGVVEFERTLPRRGSSCTGFADTFVYVKFPATGEYTFVEAGFYPRLRSRGTTRIDDSPRPTIRLDPCDNIQPIRRPYVPGAASRAYARLSSRERAAVARETDRRFRTETAIRRQLRSPGDLPLIRQWLRIRDGVLARRG